MHTSLLRAAFSRLAPATLVATAVLLLVAANGEQASPTMYELAINGEKFTIPVNEAVELKSKKQANVTYKVALRVALVQRLTLNTLRLDYDRAFAVTDDHGADLRTATLRHELGFSLLVTDLGGPLVKGGRKKVLDTLSESMQRQLTAEQAKDVQVSKTDSPKFKHARSTGLTITFTDSEGTATECLVYVLDGKDFSATCIMRYPSESEEDALPLLESVLDSLRAK